MQRQTQQREATAGIAALASRSPTLHLQAGYSAVSAGRRFQEGMVRGKKKILVNR